MSKAYLQLDHEGDIRDHTLDKNLAEQWREDLEGNENTAFPIRIVEVDLDPKPARVVVEVNGDGTCLDAWADTSVLVILVNFPEKAPISGVYHDGVSEVSLDLCDGLIPIDINRVDHYFNQIKDVTPAPTEAPTTINQHIANLLALKPEKPVTSVHDFLEQLEDHDRECWEQYLVDGDYFPAGGLWLNYSQWLGTSTSCGKREIAHPEVVAYMLENDGDLPEKYEILVNGRVSIAGPNEVYYEFDTVNVFSCMSEGSKDMDFWFFHKLDSPTRAEVFNLIAQKLGLRVRYGQE